jgi:hypothetical protein
MEIGRMLNVIDEQERADPLPSRVDVPDDLAPEDRSLVIEQAFGGQGDRSDRRLGHRVYLLVVLAILGSAAIAGALLFNRLVVEDSSAPAAPAATPAAAPAAGVIATPSPAEESTPTSSDGQRSPAASPSTSGATDPSTLRLRTKWGPYAPITLLGQNGDGTVRVAKIPSARGTWTWVGDDLRIRFTGKVTLSSGRRVQTGAKITCTGPPTAAKLRCQIRTEAFGTTKSTTKRQWVTMKAVGRLQ